MLSHPLRPLAHQSADGGRRDTENGDPVILDQSPEAIGARIMAWSMATSFVLSKPKVTARVDRLVSKIACASVRTSDRLRIFSPRLNQSLHFIRRPRCPRYAVAEQRSSRWTLKAFLLFHVRVESDSRLWGVEIGGRAAVRTAPKYAVRAVHSRLSRAWS